jgi:hypothetical protein
MVNKTQVIQSNDASIEAADSLGDNVGGFAHDLLMLAELQAQLLLAEVLEFRQRSILPCLFLVSGLMLGTACFPIALITLALVLAQVANLSMAIAFLIVLGFGSVGSLLLTILGLLQVRKSKQFMPRSQEEFARNYQWMKSAFNKRQMVRRNSPDTQKEPK